MDEVREVTMARKRRGPGEGGVYQRADGRWAAAPSLGFGPDGKRRRRVVYGRTKQEVLDKLREVDPKGGAGSAAPTVERFLASWLEWVKSSVELTSWDVYEQHVRLHIAPRIGGVKLSPRPPFTSKYCCPTCFGTGSVRQ